MESHLTIKHLAPYLPYDLELQIDEIYKGFKCKLVIFNHTTSFANGVELKSALTFNCKPILRPLSDLIKEIEVNGEKFVPIAELLKIKYPYRGDFKDMYASITVDYTGYPSAYYSYMATKDIIINPNDCENLPYWIIQKLFEWHFDIFNLIPENLAIDINTLNIKQ